MNSSRAVNPEIKKFIEAFEPNKFKILKSGIEVRGVSDIHSAIEFAKQIIQRFKLNLSIKHTAEMTMYGGFEVIEN